MGMGMTGAAMATVLGSLVQNIILISYVLLGKTSLHLAKPFKWFKAVKNISVLGIGAGVTQIAMTLVTYIINNQIMKYSGSDALAVYGMLSTVTALFISIFAGIGQATQPVVSVNYGASQKERYQMVGRLGLKVALISGLVCFGICALFPSQMVSLFMKVTPGVAEIAPYIIRVYAISYLSMAISLFITAYLQSVGRVNSATLVSMLRGIVLSAILLYVLPLLMGGSGIWWAVTIAESGAAIVGIFYMIPEFKKAK